jgi:Glycine zipper
MPERAWNPWKMTAIGMGLTVAVAVVTGVVVASWPESEPARKTDTAAVARKSEARAPAIVAAARTVAAPTQAAVPSQVAIDACNQQAASQTSKTGKTVEIVKDGAIGAAIGAAVGAAGGAIADGGSGAGKGAVIGGLVGAGGGALYGVNENRKNDARYRDAYAGCMRSRGFAS